MHTIRLLILPCLYRLDKPDKRIQILIQTADKLSRLLCRNRTRRRGFDISRLLQNLERIAHPMRRNIKNLREFQNAYRLILLNGPNYLKMTGNKFNLIHQLLNHGYTTPPAAQATLFHASILNQILSTDRYLLFAHLSQIYCTGIRTVLHMYYTGQSCAISHSLSRL